MTQSDDAHKVCVLGYLSEAGSNAVLMILLCVVILVVCAGGAKVAGGGGGGRGHKAIPSDAP